MFNFFFFNDTATTEIYTLSLHDALPIFLADADRRVGVRPRVLVEQERVADDLRLRAVRALGDLEQAAVRGAPRSEEHTSELQSRQYLVCRLLLEKKKKRMIIDKQHQQTQ